ncbi:SDR family oxidoreductase [Bacillus sp. 31A1R]|uniref:SDR family oxidoreductase n=1 Tax=Robertmurraya mangrovi TaxID=3098077 RepID=A0ABU5J1L0_9BACI|nr:SDR family oxidoreductase [Bacillus sp. 31A1R]MDZ5473307.1 SDR family oxidoreductase [Bacillus sp. 31A1R]
MKQPITLITGTRKGIGKHLVNHYVQKGHKVIGCSRSLINWELNDYIHFQVDVTDERSVKAMFSSIKKEHGRIDHLINNAGIASMNHFMLTPISTANNVLQTNVIGTFLLCREAAKLMQKQKYGRIVNFGTVATPLKLEGEAIYAASKAAVISLTEVIARELAPFEITVNSIGPTPVETDLIRSVPKEKLEELINRQAIKRYGTFEDISNAIDFFLQKSSSFITGQTLFLGGV